MSYLVLAVALAASLGTSLAQRRPVPYWSLGGYGNVVFPGTGHAPHTPPGGVTGPYFFNPLTRGVVARPRMRHSSPNVEPVILPYPMFPDSPPEDLSMDASQPIGMSSNPVPIAVAPQYSPPTSIRQAPEPVTAESGAIYNHEKPTVYLIALKNHTVVEALGYWMELSSLHYVSVDCSVNQVTLDLVDREASTRMNAERGIEIRLPTDTKSRR